MDTIVNLIQTKLLEIYPTLDDEKQKVLHAIWDEWQYKKKITQKQIAEKVFDIGYHEKHESDLGLKKSETTLRKVRQVIRYLRVDHNIPILSDRGGYWLPTSKDECFDYITRLEAVARAQAAAWYETYRAMEKTVGVRSEFFEKQQSINFSGSV